MPSTSATKKSTVSLPADVYWRPDQRRVGNQEAAVQAVQQWIDGRSDRSAARRAGRGGVWVEPRAVRRARAGGKARKSVVLRRRNILRRLSGLFTA